MIIEFLQTRSALVVAVLGLVTYYVIPYLLDPLDYRRFQGPRLAAFTNWWMSNTIRAGRHCEVVKELHDKYGTFVRLGPDHVSIADPEALEAVYGHSSGLLKSDFYRIFQNGDPDIFNTQDKTEHTIKRKRIAHVFSPQNILALEPRISSHIQALCEQLDLRCNAALEGLSGFNWRAENGRAMVDCCLQFGYLAFDIISDLALGSSFDMVPRQRDTVPTSPGVDSPDGTPQKIKELPVIKTEERGMMIITSVGVFPRWSHHFLLLLPWNIPALIDQVNFFTMATAAVSKRLERGSKRSEGRDQADLLEKLYEAREEDPEGDSVISHQELIAEALIMINAGGETTSHTLGALCYYLATHPEIQRRLQEELDQHAPFHNESDEYSESPTVVVEYEQVKNLPYLDACVKEALRLHSTIGTGLQRVVPPGKTFTFGGQTFKAGSVISVPSFTINRSSLWGAGSQEFCPERWLEDESNSLTQYFAPFSLGPRGCIGRNLAMM